MIADHKRQNINGSSGITIKFWCFLDLCIYIYRDFVHPSSKNNEWTFIYATYYQTRASIWQGIIVCLLKYYMLNEKREIEECKGQEHTWESKQNNENQVHCIVRTYYVAESEASINIASILFVCPSLATVNQERVDEFLFLIPMDFQLLSSNIKVKGQGRQYSTCSNCTIQQSKLHVYFTMNYVSH